MVRTDALFHQAVGQLVILGLPSSGFIELPLVRHALPTNIRHLLGSDRLAVEGRVERTSILNL